MKRAILFVFILACCMACFFVGYESGKIKDEPAFDAMADTIVLKDTVLVPSPPVLVKIKMPVPMKVDTAAILADFYTQKIVHDTIIKDKYVEVQLTDTVYQNTLLGRTATYTVNVPTNNRGLVIGADVGRKNYALRFGYRVGHFTYSVGYNIPQNAPFVGINCEFNSWHR